MAGNAKSVTLTRKGVEDSRGEEHGLAGKATGAAHPWRAAKPGAGRRSPRRGGAWQGVHESSGLAGCVRTVGGGRDVHTGKG